MAILNIALLLATLPAVFASPHYGSMFHGPHTGSKQPSGWPAGGPFGSSTGQSSSSPPKQTLSAPYPAGNATAGGATGTPSDKVTIQSTITITIQSTIQSTISLTSQPLSSYVSSTGGESPASTGAAAGSGGASPSASGSGRSGAPEIPSGSGQTGSVCGPATTTITKANTITVTVKANLSQAPIQSPAPIQSQAPIHSPAPSPVGNSSIPAVPTGTGLINTSQTQASATVTAENDQSAMQPSPVKSSSSSPVAQATTATVNIETSSIAPPSSSTAPSSSAPSGASDTGLGVPHARGLLYSGKNLQVSPADSLKEANAAIDTSVIGWMANWDSSAETMGGPASGSAHPKVEYVPQLHNLGSIAVDLWPGNSKGASWVLSFNEPDNCGGGGACIMDVPTAVQGHNEHMKDLRASGTKVSTPCTMNTLNATGIGFDYLESFLASYPKPAPFDCVCMHWYGEGWNLLNKDHDPNSQSLENVVAAYKNLQTQYGIPELWIPEMAPHAGATPEQISAMIDWLDDFESSGVNRYAFNGFNVLSAPVNVNSMFAYTS